MGQSVDFGVSSDVATSTDDDGGEARQEASDPEYQDVSALPSVLPDVQPKRVLVFTTMVLLGRLYFLQYSRILFYNRV